MNTIKVTEKDHYFTVVATKKIVKGDLILNLQGTTSPIPTKYSIQIGSDKHLLAPSNNPQDESSGFRFLNHSCSPNSYFDIPNMSLLALKDIEEGEEITYHYCTTEYKMSSPFQCLCGSKNCLHEIKGFYYLSEERKQELLSQLAPHLKKL